MTCGWPFRSIVFQECLLRPCSSAHSDAFLPSSLVPLVPPPSPHLPPLIPCPCCSLGPPAPQCMGGRGRGPGHSWNRMGTPDVRKRVPYTLGSTPRAAASLGVWGCATGRAPEGDHSRFFSFGPGPRRRAAQSACRLSRLGSVESVEICNFCTPRALQILMPHIIFSSRCGSNEPSSGEIRPLIAEI